MRAERISRVAFGVTALAVLACGPGGSPDTVSGTGPDAGRAPQARPLTALTDSAFGALHARISEPGGFFDTDNLISNETGYLKVIGALERSGLTGGAYVGVGPDQNYSYIAALRPGLAVIVDIRRDNVLQHLLLKALVERSPTRVEFLSALHGRTPPADPSVTEAWGPRQLVDAVRDAAADPELSRLQDAVVSAAAGFGISLDDADRATVRRFHQAFVDAGPGLRFTSFGRPPRPYYPTFAELVAETDAEGRPASWLATAGRYRVVRDLHRAHRILPVVGDLAGDHAVREIGRVLDERGLELTAFYTSNVEFYLWRGGGFGRWTENLAQVPARPDAVVIRSYFPNFGGGHPSAIPGYYATQTLQPVRTLLDGGFTGYFDVVTRDLLPLREPAGAR